MHAIINLFLIYYYEEIVQKVRKDIKMNIVNYTDNI